MVEREIGRQEALRWTRREGGRRDGIALTGRDSLDRKVAQKGACGWAYIQPPATSVGGSELKKSEVT
jgi:hypothetical protein